MMGGLVFDILAAVLLVGAGVYVWRLYVLFLAKHDK